MSNPSPDALNAFFKNAFDGHGICPIITEARDGFIQVTLEMGPYNLRPGGFVSGPTQMALADHAAYAAVFTKIGITPMALTSNLNIDFLRPLTGAVIQADATVIKIGRSLAIITVDITGDQIDKLSSRATVTYALPAA